MESPKRRKTIFWFAIIASLIAGLYGLLTNQMVIFIPYAFLNPALLFVITSLKIFEPIKQKLETLGAIGILINIPGSLYLHRLGVQYDIPLHFAAGLIAFSAINSAMPLLIKKVRWTPVSSVFLVIIAGLAFEGIQKLSDTILGTQLFSDVRQPAALDFAIDILMNALGAIAALLSAKPASSQSGPASPDRV